MATKIDFNEVMPPLSTMSSIAHDAEATRQTTTTVAGTPYSIVGNFTHSPLVGFSEASDILTYTGTMTRELRFNISSSMKASAGLATLHVGIFYNGTLYSPESEAGTYEKSSGEAKAMSVSFKIPGVATNDTFEYVLWCDKAGAVVTVTHFTATIDPSGR